MRRPPENEPEVDLAKLVVADNLKRLMAQSVDLRTIKQLHARSGVSTGTIDRIRRAEVAAGVDTLRLLAGAFGLDAWKLLVPDLDPTNPPMLVAESERLKALYATLQRTTEAIQGHLRVGGNTGTGGLEEIGATKPQRRSKPGGIVKDSESKRRFANLSAHVAKKKDQR